MSLEEKLNHFLELDEKWDGYSAKKISSLAVKAASQLTVVPTSAGGAQIELYAGGSDVVIEIDDLGTIISVFWGRSK